MFCGGRYQWIKVHLTFVYAHQRSPACRGQTTVKESVPNLRKFEFHIYCCSAIYGWMALTFHLIRCQKLHRHDQNSWSQKQLSLQISRANLTRQPFLGNFLLRDGEVFISSTSLESKADIPNLSHSAFSCWAIVVRGTNIEVVEPGVKWTSYWSHKNWG